jgi:hypothetical protein
MKDRDIMRNKERVASPRHVVMMRVAGHDGLDSVNLLT